MHTARRMWTDETFDQFEFEAEDDPRLAHFAIVMYAMAAVAATVLTIFLVLHSPMHY